MSRGKICSLIFLILFKICLGVQKLGQWRKKCIFVSVSSQSHNGFRNLESWKQCLNLLSQGWLRLRCNLVRSLVLHKLWIPKILFAQSCIKYKVYLKKKKKKKRKKREMWDSNFPMKFVLLKYSRRKEQILQIILSYMNYTKSWPR